MSALTGSMDESGLRSLMEASREFTKAYESVSDLLKTKGPEAALEYIKAINQVTTRVSSTSDSLRGFTDALDDNANRLSQAYTRIKETLREQTEAAVAADIKAKSLGETIGSLAAVSAEANDVFVTHRDSIKNASAELFRYIEAEAGSEEAKLKSYDATIKLIKAYKDQDDASTKPLEDHLRGLEQTLRLQGLEEDKINKIVDRTRQYATATREAVVVSKNYADSTNEEYRRAAAAAQMILQEAEAIDDRTLAEKRSTEVSRNLTTARAEKDVSDATKGLNRDLERLFDNFTGAAKSTNLLSTAMMAAAGPGGVGALATSLTKNLTNAFIDPEKAAMRLYNFLDNFIFKPTLKFDQTFAELGKNTGGFRTEGMETITQQGMLAKAFGIRESIPEMSSYGITVKELSAAYSGLSKSIGGFNNLSVEQRKELTATAAQLNNLGVEFSSFGNIASKYMAVMSTDTGGATLAIKNLAQAAVAAGKDVGSYLKDFDSLMPKLFGYAEPMDILYQKLNGLSQAINGVASTSDLQKVADQFRHFGQASDAIAKLALAFDGVVPDMSEVLAKDPVEIILAIKDAADRAGTSFEGLSKQQKEIAAEAVGLNAMQMQAIMKMSSAQMRIQMNARVPTDKKLQERIAEAKSEQDKLNAAIDNMKIALAPGLKVFTFLAKVIELISSALSPTGTVFLGVGILIGSIQMLFRALASSMITAFNAIFSNLELRINNSLLKINMANTNAMGGGVGMGGLGRGMGILAGVTAILGIGSAIYGAVTSKDNNTSTPTTRPPSGGGEVEVDTTTAGLLTSNMSLKKGTDAVIAAFEEGSSTSDGEEEKAIVSNGKIINLDKRDTVVAFTSEEKKQILNQLNKKINKQFSSVSSPTSKEDSNYFINSPKISSVTEGIDYKVFNPQLETMPSVLSELREVTKERYKAEKDRMVELTTMVVEKTQNNNISGEDKRTYVLNAPNLIARIHADDFNQNLKNTIVATVQAMGEASTSKAGLRANLPNQIIT